jgi:branched-chain amino acid transport system ATP-binding protein
LALPEERLEATAVAVPARPDLLKVARLSAGYGRRQVVFDVDLRVGEGEVVTILGHNGAGKTTILKAIFGLLKPFGGTVTFQGADVTNDRPAHKVRCGMSFIPAEHPVFGPLSVVENLKLGGLRERSAADRDAHLGKIYEMFPILRERGSQLASTMSGGQQRMLSIGISLVAGPRLMLVDEPSLGLSPALVQQVMDALRELAEHEGISVLMLEQNVTQSLRVSDRAYVLRSGRIILEEPADKMLARGQWWDLF